MRTGLEAAALGPPFFCPPRGTRRRAVATALGFVLALAWTVPAGAEVIDRVAAAVGGEAIARSAVDDAWEALQAGAPGAPPTREALLGRMVDVRVQLQRAHELGLEARSEDVEDALSHIMADNGIPNLQGLSDALAREGRTLEDLRREVRDQISVMRLVQREVTSKVKLSDADLKAYYDAHRADFATGRSVRVRQIVFLTRGLGEDDLRKVGEAMGALRQGLTGPESFRQAEERLKDTPGVVTGEAGVLAEEDLRPELARVLMALAPGQVSPPLPLPNGLAVFLVEARTEGAPAPFKDVVDDVRRAATEERTQAAGREWLAQLKRESFIQVKDPNGGPDFVPTPEPVTVAPQAPAPAPVPEAKPRRRFDPNGDSD